MSKDAVPGSEQKSTACPAGVAAGAGSAAAAYLNGNGASASSGSGPSPKLPDGPPSGRPQPSSLTKENMGSDSAAEEEMWRGVLKGIAGADVTGENFQRCITMAAHLQRASSELISQGRAAGLNEEELKRLVARNLFLPCPNPQDGARATQSSPSKECAGSQAETATEEDDMEANRSIKAKTQKVTTNPRASAAQKRATIGASEVTQIQQRKSIQHISTETLQKRRSLKMGQGSCPGSVVTKHLNGCPSAVYDLGAQLGEGAFGVVCKARHKTTGQIHAVKSVNKDKIENKEELWQEIDIMKQLDHPHLMRLYYTFETETAIHMASELCAGGELYDTIEEAGFLTERACALVVAQILGAVNYLHFNFICHRDLKPENFLVQNRVEHHLIKLKLIDFGTAKRFDKSPMTTKICTAHYVAPEVLKRGEIQYSEKVDVWSCGVILYMMLCGFMPFHHEDHMELLKMVKKGKYSFKPEKVWKLISDEAKELIGMMMCLKADARASALQCFQHVWVTKKQEDEETSVDEQIVRQMRKFLTNNRLKRVALQIIARQISDESIVRLRNIFMGIDEDCSGCLTLEEMTEAIKGLNLSESSQQEMAQILVCVDQDESGTIEWTEFLAATLTKEQYLKEDVCRGAFHLLDIDEDGVLNREDLSNFLSHEVEAPSGRRMSGLMGQHYMAEIEQIMQETDENGDGDISFLEFMGLMSEDGPRDTDTAVSLRYHRKGKKECVEILRGSVSKGSTHAGDEEEMFSTSDEEDPNERGAPSGEEDSKEGELAKQESE